MKSTFIRGIISLVSLLLLSTGFLHAQNLNEVKVNAEYKNQPLKDFLVDLETKHNLKIFYKDAWIAPYTINNRFENTPLIQALNNVFVNHELNYEFFQDDGIVIFRRISDTRSKFDDFSQTLVIGNPMNVGRYKNANLLGRVIDGKTGEPLVGAVVFNTKLQKGTTSDANGNFELAIPTGDHKLDISFIGFESSALTIRLIENGAADFQLFEESHSIGEVTVLGKGADVPRAQMSMVQMSSKELKQLPALMGEVDVLKGLTMLAGVQTVSELSSGFNVRGGNTDQNLILINGSPVFNSSHLFGFMSLINPDVVEDVRLFKGGMPVKYGERVASVMEVDFKDGNNDHLQASGGIGTISSRLALDGPLTKNKKLTFIAGGRASYTDWILKELPDVDLNQSVTKFYDLSGKVTYKFNAHNKLSVMGYSSNDEFSTSSQSVTEYGNMLGNLKLNTRWAEKLFGDLELAYSKYDYRLTDFADDKPNEAYYLDNSLEYTSGAYNFKWHPNIRHNVEFGFKGVYNRISPGTITPQQEQTIIEKQELNLEKTIEWAAYIGDEFELTPNISMVGGIRYSAFRNIGTPLVYLYDPNKPIEPENVIGSLTFDENETSASYSGIEPRFSMSFDVNSTTTLKLNYQRNNQYVFQLSNNAVISPA